MTTTAETNTMDAETAANRQAVRPPAVRMVRGELYTTPKGMVGRACRHPYHEAGSVGYIETADGDLWSVYGVAVRRATATEARRFRRERLAFYEEG
jgi:hypothetical protein